MSLLPNLLAINVGNSSFDLSRRNHVTPKIDLNWDPLPGPGVFWEPRGLRQAGHRRGHYCHHSQGPEVPYNTDNLRFA